MKKVFTFVLAMTIVVAGFAQIKSARPDFKQMKSAQAVTLTGFEERDYADFPAADKGIVESADEIVMSQTCYDWQSNMGARNYTAVWPDGYAVMCYTQATDAAYSDRGTGLAIWDPAVGEWEYTETRVEGLKTGFGAISRYKENGLVIAAHTASDARIFIVEDFRQGNRDFGQGIPLPVTTGVDPVWPAIQCSGENLDIINILITNSGATEPCTDPLVFYQYVNGEWTHQYEVIAPLDGDHMTDGGSNIAYFMRYNPEKPNRVAFILNNAWSDCKAVISEDNGATWTDERVFWQHPGINADFTDEWFFYPRWTGAEFDANDNLHVVYEYNGSTGTAGSGSYYPSIGGVGYWSETLTKSADCLGGIGNVGEPFIMDSTYLIQDFHGSNWWWSDANHDPLPQNFGMLQIIDENGDVYPWYAETLPDVYYWVYNSDNMAQHGKYNNGIVGFASMHMEGNNIYAFWSMLAGDDGSGDSGLFYWDGEYHYFRLFGAMSQDGGQTWGDPVHLITDVAASYDEKVYGQVIPYVYHDAEGAYLWYVYQSDEFPGTVVQPDDEHTPDTNPDDNFYMALKVYVSTIMGVEEESDAAASAINMTVFPNPANGSFTMELNEEADVNIFNAVGQLVKNYESVKSVKVTDLSAGIYFVKAGNQTQKVVVF